MAVLTSSLMSNMAASIRRFLPQLAKSFENRFCVLQRRCGSTSVSSILKNKPIGKESSVKGWVKGIQKHKGVTFLHLTDGSSPQHLQVILPELVARTLIVTFGSCVHAEGVITESMGKGQEIEMMSSNIQVIGSCDPFEFPLRQRHRHPPQYTRDFPHLRPKYPVFNSLLRIRNAASMAVHQYFQREKYMFIHTPILTSSDCEGACEVFQVEPMLAQPVSDDSEWDLDSSSQEGHSDSSDEGSPGHFFKHPAYLTVSGQLHLEVMTGAFTKVYNFGPTFRAESSRGSFHLSEFYMVEAELAFIESLEDLLEVMESLVKFVHSHVMHSCPEDVDIFSKSVAPADFQKSVDKMMQSKFKRISYTDAVDLLLQADHDFRYKVSWGSNLMKEHEMYLTQALGGMPVFVTDYPSDIKPFYAKRNQDHKTVSTSDLLVPNVGELCGSSLREDRLDVLTDSVNAHGLVGNLDWYLDLRRFGSCPHGGFGLGFERLLMFLLGAHSLKDVTPFPRWPGRCDL